MNPLILLIVGAVGLAGCVILLLLGLTMLREERAAKDAPNAAGLAPGAAAPAVDTRSAPPSVQSADLAGSQPEPLKPEAARASGGTAVGAALAGVTARFTGGAARGSAHEVLRVLRDNLTGRLVLEIAGKRYANLDEVADGDMRQALMTTLRDLEAFSGEVVSLMPGAQNAESPAPSPARQAAASRTARPVADASPAAPAEYRPLPPPTMNPFKQMAVLREMAKNPPPPPKSITEQIDEVLQERIIGTPLIHRGLHVRPGPRGDAVFEADGQSYPSVDELPDVEVRDVVRAAIAEWEKKQ